MAAIMFEKVNSSGFCVKEVKSDGKRPEMNLIRRSLKEFFTSCKLCTSDKDTKIVGE